MGLSAVAADFGDSGVDFRQKRHERHRAGFGNPNERGMAVAGYIMGIISVVLSVLGLCCVGGAIAGVIGLSAAPFWGQWQFQF